MAEVPFFSSQGSQYEQHQILQEQENLPSSPVARLKSQKPKKPPTVTPKRFTKFFTPRTSLSTRGGRQSKAGRQLRDITKNGANRRKNARGVRPVDFTQTEEEERPSKRRKQSIDLASSPPPFSSPLNRVQAADQIQVFEDEPASSILSDEDALTDILEDLHPFPKSIRRLPQSSHSRRILQRGFGGFDAVGTGRRGYDHCADWRAETSNFVSTPTDIHQFNGSALPFCTASCNTNSFIAIGEEEGGVRLIDSSPASDFTTSHVAFRPHHNAIMDVAFSSDDYTLATASGDQTSRIIDMHTQRTICILSGHKSSVKQIRFQPNDDNMLTTSSRDGSVLLWDMRCGGTGSVQSLRSTFARNVDNGGVDPIVRYSKYSLDVGIAHRSTKGGNLRTASTDNSDAAGVSITSIQHLPDGQEHLLLTTSEINSSIKLWDLRNVGRRTSNALLSSTPVPSPHSRTRHYGINAMVLSTDGARLYAACRDGAVYAYSTNHLALSCSSDSSSSSAKGRVTKTSKSGLGPLYGFRHPLLRMGTFYVKASLRPARGMNSEMLAIGSTDNCAVLIPTDERHLPARERLTDIDEEDDEDLPSVPILNPRTAARNNDIPIYEQATALIRGHNKEVTSLTWTHDGDLVTVGDDFSARQWREDGDKARELRGCGEAGGARWGCGWADVDPVWDEEEEG